MEESGSMCPGFAGRIREPVSMAPQKGVRMEFNSEEDVKFLVHHQTTEKELFHLEKGMRTLGMRSGGDRILGWVSVFAIFCMVVGRHPDSLFGILFLGLGILCFVVFFVRLYSFFKKRQEAKRQVHLQFEAGGRNGNHTWEYRFYETCYEAIGRNGVTRRQYSDLGRLLEFTGMLVLVERGNLVRYFVEEDVENGTAEELMDFLEERTGLRFEFVPVRGI